MPNEKKPKTKYVEYLRHAEYYDMQSTFDELYARSQAGEIFDGLMDVILSRENILLAYRNIKSNTGSFTPGTDKLKISDIGKLTADEVTARVRRIVKGGKNGYTPRSVRRKEIPKPNGSTRPLGIPCIWDRLVQQCIKQVMEPICEARFSNNSYGFRPNRSVENAIAAIYRLMQRSGLYYVVEFDIKGFFDNVDHSKLIKQLWSLNIRDKELLYVIRRILKAPKGNGGSDKYENLVLVLAPVHELIHAVNEDTICSYLSALKLDASQLMKLNRLRILANRKPIDLENLNLTNNSHNGMTKETKKTV